MKRFLFALALAISGAAHAAEGIFSAAPLFSAALHDLDGKPATLDRFKGRPLVVNFWARWCGPCREEIPELVKARTRLKARGVEVIGIAIEDKHEPVREFAKAYEMDYPVLLVKDKGIELMQSLGNTRAGLPFTIAVDRQGRVAYKKLGLMKAVEVQAAFDAAAK